MKRAAAIALGLALLLFSLACSRPLQPEDSVQYFFSGLIVGAQGARLSVEVSNPGNSGLPDGAIIEVSVPFPDLALNLDLCADARARVLMTKSETEDSAWRLTALSLR